jgi:hypothetical protein
MTFAKTFITLEARPWGEYRAESRPKSCRKGVNGLLFTFCRVDASVLNPSLKTAPSAVGLGLKFDTRTFRKARG